MTQNSAGGKQRKTNWSSKSAAPECNSLSLRHENKLAWIDHLSTHRWEKHVNHIWSRATGKLTRLFSTPIPNVECQAEKL